ncbi:MAG: helix-turn-helix domain-containing protein [Limnochordaceae bacterium]|nr:helix-turn-helix domain-containing protein [Limnochordaceae bacterium]
MGSSGSRRALKSSQPTWAEQLVADGLLTVKQAAEFLGISRSQVYALMERGELPYVKIGSSRRIPKRALIAFAARHLVAGTSLPIEW